MSLQNKVALVTGASRGIGEAIALELGRDGAVVIGTATTEEGAEHISSMFKQQGITGQGLVLNVADANSIEETINRINGEFETPTILVNNAGITRDNLLLRMKDDEWDSIMRTNLDSIYRLSKACLKGMIKARWGRIINISSVVGVTGNPGQSNYCAAKAGVIGFSKALAQEVGSRYITVNVVAPGFIDTRMTSVLNETQRDALLSRIPLNRLGDATDIAAAVAFLASPRAGYITGQTLHVNGGMYMA